MLRKSQIRPGRWMAILVALGALIVLLLWVAVAWASEITVDGTCTPNGEWADPEDWVVDDGDQVGVEDEYDIDPVYATVNDSQLQHFIRFNTVTDVGVTSGGYVQIWYDTDDNTSTGYEGTTEMVGADAMVLWYLNSDDCSVSRWDEVAGAWDEQDTDCNGEYGDPGTCVEVGADMEDLLLGGPPEIPICILFENGVFPPITDDAVCFDYDPTAVELSSFTACSERGRPSQPWFTWLWPVGLVSGVVAVSAGGLVLWRRKGLAR